ncbi:MAG TPA: hypothetical protein VFG23_25100 [Polyangia bacterium]|nr:hypothetical protein [Polyangia bacterium]
MRRIRVIAMMAAMAAAGAGCSPASNLLPVDDFNRPTDVAFMCFGAFPEGSSVGGTVDAGSGLSVSGRPMRACHPQAQFDPPASTTSRTFAFMPDSASGGLTMLDADNWKLIDLEQATGGYGQLPLGELPSQISVSDDGCRLISANRGSCDLTLVDPSIIVAPVIHDEDDSNVSLPPLPRTASETIQPIKGDGTLLTAAPYEAVFLPQDTSALQGADALCSPPGMLSQAGPVGWNTPAGTQVPWYALVTYPSCDLIVLVELPSGRIVQSVRAVGDSVSNTVTFQDAGTSPVCASVDCPGQTVRVSDAAVTGFDAATSAGVDAAASDGDAGPVAPTPDAAGAAAVDAASLVADAGSGATGSGGAAGAGGAGGSGGAAGAGPSASGALPGNQYQDQPHVGSPVGPSGIAIVPDGTRVYVSLSNASYVGSFGLSAAGLALPGNAIYLHEGAVGSNRIRLSVQPYASTTTATSAEFVGSDTGSKVPELRYLYVIAKDGTLRVVQTFLPGQEQECETNADPLHLAPGISATTPCIAVDPAKNPRRPFAVGPGLHFPTAPVDVTAVDIRANAADPKPFSEQSIYGAHAWVLTTSGVVYLVNIDPYPRMYYAPTVENNFMIGALPNVTEQTPFENTLRDRNEITYSLTLDPSSGPPRLDVLPNIAATGPYIEPFWTKGTDLNATQQTNNYVETDVLFPKEPDPSSVDDPIDRRAVTPQTWTVTWEGPLTGTRYTGQVTPEGMGAPPPAEPTDAHHTVFKDGGGNFCGVGVLPGDLLTLTGCTVDAQCGLGEGCLVDTTVATGAGGVPVTGLCVDPNRVDAQSAACASFLASVRRYEVVAAYPSELVIHPHLDELARSSLTPCQPADPDLPVSNDCIDPNDPTTDKFTCESVYPGVGNGPRCLMKGCQNDFDCRVGRTCVDFTNANANVATSCKDGHCFCADAPPLTTAGAGCFDQLVAYQVNVGNGYLVAGSQTGLITTASPNADGSCSLTPTPDPRFTFRIPMDAPHCRNIPDNSFDTRIDPDVIGDTTASTQWATYETEWISRLVGLPESDFDPCLYLGGPAGTETQVDPTVATPDPTSTLLPNVPRHVRALFRNSQITFVLANIDLQPTGQLLTGFDVHGGFQAQVIQDPTTVEVSMPARIVVGPLDTQAQTGVMPTGFAEQPYLFVVDQRRLGREQGGGPTRGQLLRIHPLGFTSSVGPAVGLQPIFQDYTASGGLFPIQ